MTKYIAIDGKGGSGKTYLSNLLAKKLECRVLHLDDFGDDFHPFVGVPGLVEAITDAAGEKFVIFEGVGVFKDEFEKFEAFKVFVDTPENIRKQRVESRDVPRSDRSEEDWKRIFQIWNLAETEYFTDELKSKANVVVGKDGEFNPEEIISESDDHFSFE